MSTRTSLLPTQGERFAARRFAAMPLRAAASDPPAEGADSDDLDDELDETGAVTNRSDGKSGTNTTAEPDPKKQPSGS